MGGICRSGTSRVDSNSNPPGDIWEHPSALFVSTGVATLRLEVLERSKHPLGVDARRYDLVFPEDRELPSHKGAVHKVCTSGYQAAPCRLSQHVPTLVHLPVYTIIDFGKSRLKSMILTEIPQNGEFAVRSRRYHGRRLYISDFV